MNYTTHYNLKKPAGTDNIAISDFNDNADALDAAVYANATTVIYAETTTFEDNCTFINFKINGTSATATAAGQAAYNAVVAGRNCVIKIKHQDEDNIQLISQFVIDNEYNVNSQYNVGSVNFKAVQGNGIVYYLSTSDVVGYQLNAHILDYKEAVANKVTSISSSSTDTQYPSAKAVYDFATSSNNFINLVYDSTANTIKVGTTTQTFAQIKALLTGNYIVRLTTTGETELILNPVNILDGVIIWSNLIYPDYYELQITNANVVTFTHQQM